MKSVIQESSSLCKAIEQGWIKAGKPKEFSIRILQDANKNFLGITTQTAKIAVFFGRIDEKPFQQSLPRPDQRERTQTKPIQPKPQPAPQQTQPPKQPQQQQQQQPVQRKRRAPGTYKKYYHRPPTNRNNNNNSGGTSSNTP